MSEKEFYKNQESMRKPSLTTFTRLVQPVFGNIGKTKQMLPLLLLLLVGQVFGQVTATFACLGNATTAGDGQYRVEICYQGDPGETYLITALDHIYDDFIAPTYDWTEFTVMPVFDETNGVYCIQNTVMQELSNGSIYIDGVEYVITAPQYPTNLISGPTQVCATNSSPINETFAIVNDSGLGTNYSWTIDGVVVSTTSSLTIDFSVAPYNIDQDYEIEVTAEDEYGCMIDASLTVTRYNLSDRVQITGISSGTCGTEYNYELSGPSDFATISWDVLQSDLVNPLLNAQAPNTAPSQVVDDANMTTADITFIDGENTYFVTATGTDVNGCTFMTSYEVEIVGVSGDLILLDDSSYTPADTDVSPIYKICREGMLDLELDKDLLPGFDADNGDAVAWSDNDSGSFSGGNCSVFFNYTGLPNTTMVTVTASGTYAQGNCPFSDSRSFDLIDVSDHWVIVGETNPYCGDVTNYTIDAIAGQDTDCLILDPSRIYWEVRDVSNNVYTGADGVQQNDGTEFQVDWNGTTNTEDYYIVFSGSTTQGCAFEVILDNIGVRSLSNLEIQGDSYVCLSDDTFMEYCFELTESDLDANSVDYTLRDYLGNDVDAYLAPNSSDDTKVTINWPAGAEANSPYVLTLTGDRANGACGFTATKTIEVVDNVQPGQIACNNHVYITLNQLCDLVVTPDMILEGVSHPEPDRFEVTITDGSGAVVSGTLNGDHVGQTFQVMVQEDCSGNICWGYITVEDKSIPQLECPDGPFVIECDELSDMTLTGFPVFDPAVGVVNNNDGTWTISGFDNCTDATLTYSDALESNSCEEDEPASTYTRTWVITDQSGSSSSCSYSIEITRPSTSTIVAPPNFDDNIAGAEPAIDVCSLDDPFTNPGPEITGMPTGLFCLNVTLDENYVDVLTLWKCGDPNDLSVKLSSPARKIIREWTVSDNCTGIDVVYKQIISLVDKTAPVLAPAFGLTDPNETVIDDPTDPNFGDEDYDGYLNQDDEGYYLVDAHQYNCSDAVTLYPFPGSGQFGEYAGLIGECSDITMNVGYLVPLPGTPDPDLSQDFIMFPNPICDVNDNVTIPAVDGTAVWVRYEFEDACGNVAIAQAANPNDPDTDEPVFLGVSSFELRFEDNTPPQPVCDVYSVVALDEMCMAFARPETFDDGSFDNCDLADMKVRRADSNSSDWFDEVKFDENDIVSSPVGVYLNVYDSAGNSSSCLVSVTVMNPNLSTYTCPAETASADCTDTWLDNLSLGNSSPVTLASNISVIPSSFGQPSVSNSCASGTDAGSYVEHAPVVHYTECQISSITRSWTITLNDGSTISCNQVITVNNVGGFVESDINWPDEEAIVSCTADISPEALGEVTFESFTCGNVVATHDDLPFQYVANTADYCQKVIRTWSVRDWCNPGSLYTMTQVIKITDNDAPTFTSGCADVNATGSLDAVTCQVMVDGLAAQATDACTASEDLVWSYVIDYDDAYLVDNTEDGEINPAPLENQLGTSNDASGLFPPGRHTVTYTVSDFCGNEDQCTINVNVDDDVLPTPYCVDQVVTVINAVSEQAEIWAQDLDAGSFDNCFGGGGNVSVSFSPDGNTDVLFYTCDDLPNGVVDTFDVRLYVIDNDGNYDYCLTQIIVQDNSGICTDVPSSNGSGRIAGDILTEDDEVLTDVMMHLHASMPEFPMQEMTQTGQYDFADLQATQNYMVTPTKDDNHANGVSTLDIILIQRHLLNLQQLDSPYKLIAADANNNGNVSAADLVEIRNLILENINEYTNNSSWRFIHKDFTFLDALNPFPFEEEVDILDLPESTVDVDFIGVKVGDVNHSVALNFDSNATENRGNNPLKLTIQSTESQNGQVMVPVKAANDYSLVGMQLELDVNANIAGISAGLLEVNNDNIKTTQSGSVKLSWNTNSSTEIVAGDVLFTLVVDSKEAIDFNSISLVSNDIATEVYTDEGNAIGVEHIVLVEQTQTGGDGFALYQNKPNPFSEATTFSFSLPESQDATITVLEMTGKVLYSITDTYAKGYNEVDFNTASIQSSGILYLKVETETHSAIRKMIIIQ